MPLHDYKCVECGEVQEVHVPIQSAPASLRSCDCGGIMRKVFSAPGIIFRGAGWGGNYGKKNTQN